LICFDVLTALISWRFLGRVMAEPIIVVKNLCKKYAAFEAVKNISFEVEKGEIFGILGPNGAGKTTTLEIIETLRAKTSGQVLVKNFDLDTHQIEIKKIIGIQLQSAGFYPQLTCTEVLNMFGVLYGVSVNPSELLTKVDLADKAKVEVKKLSGGQQQRFSIATTLVNNPQIIFLDEPTTGLDPQARINMWQLIESIRATGTTIVMTTHYMEEAQKLCDRVAIMDNGAILKLDTPDKLIQDLVDTGFHATKVVQQADLEDVFLHLTGKTLRDT
jgi:ABC-2 type transport system ATP-binding protein